MLQQFLNHIHRHQLCKTSDKILLAVSGGLDSMVMLHLFTQAGFNVGVAHCNFQMREKESDGDEELVENACNRQKIPFYSKRFTTAATAEERKLSIQLAARELRYAFFEELVQKHQYVYVSTAHHLNDNFETVLLNLTRGTGIEGLKGIPIRNGNIIRPLLSFSRQELYDYARDQKVQWREDSSNATDDYQRNIIRHHVVPRLRDINSNLESTFRDSWERICGMNDLLTEYFDADKSTFIRKNGHRTYINKNKLLLFPYPAVVLWETLKASGFNYHQCRLIVQDHIPGKQFFSSAFTLTIDREEYIIEPSDSLVQEPISIAKGQNALSSSYGELQFTFREAINFKLTKDSSIAQLDAAKILFPLVWRQWAHGDTFTPLGMQLRKKVSDLLTDAKIPLPDKNKITVLESAGEIIWVVGMRINDAFKVTDATKQVMIISFVQDKN